MAIATVTRGEGNMLETKILLIAMAKICKSAKSRQEIYKTIEAMANADGINLPSWDDEEIAEPEAEEKKN